LEQEQQQQQMTDDAGSGAQVFAAGARAPEGARVLQIHGNTRAVVSRSVPAQRCGTSLAFWLWPIGLRAACVAVQWQTG
jgi:hypothetical protein